MKPSDCLRVLFCADLHIGKSLHGRSLLEDQNQLLDSMVDLARTQEADCVCLAGDIFDRSVPGTEAVETADRFLTALAGTSGISTLLIAGNHDSPERLDFAAGLLGRQGLHIHGRWMPNPRPLELAPADGSFRLRLLPVPYAEPVQVRHALADDTIDSHQHAWEAFMTRYLASGFTGPGPAQPGPATPEPAPGTTPDQPAVTLPPGPPALDILVCHAYLAGGEESESERPLSIGASSLVEARVFEAFDAVFAGHLHRQQFIPPRIWYPGSPYTYSASECGQEKYVLLLEVRPSPAVSGAAGNPDAAGSRTASRSGPDTWEFVSAQGLVCRVTRLALTPRRRVHRLSGFFHDLITARAPGMNAEDLVYIELQDSAPLFDAFARLQERYPGLLHLERHSSNPDAPASSQERRRQVEAGEEELIKGFLEEMGSTSQLADWLPLIRDLLDQTRQSGSDLSTEAATPDPAGSASAATASPTEGMIP